MKRRNEDKKSDTGLAGKLDNRTKKIEEETKSVGVKREALRD